MTTYNNRINTSIRRQILYYLRPIVLFMVCFFFQSVCLHISTKEYLDYMKDMNNTGQLRDIPEDLISNTLNGQQININIHLIDFIGSTPLIIYGLTNIVCLFKGLECVSILNKTFIIGSLLALMKGIFDLVTIIPDSNGYVECKNRLGTSSIHFLIAIDNFPIIKPNNNW